uniref:Ubiquitin-like domain-containing protein n=1 Tax=Globodera rostochiensis TaxID=31243 RepID=A0A914HMN0_GLORO
MFQIFWFGSFIAWLLFGVSRSSWLLLRLAIVDVHSNSVAYYKPKPDWGKLDSKVENSSKSTAQSTTAASRRGETPGSGRSPRVTRLGGVSRAPAPRILARSPPSGAPFLSSVAKVVFFHRAGHRFTVRVMHCNEIILCAATVTVSQSMVAQIEQKLGFAVEDQRLLKSGQSLSSMFKFCQDTVVELFLFQTGGMEEWSWDCKCWAGATHNAIRLLRLLLPGLLLIRKLWPLPWPLNGSLLDTINLLALSLLGFCSVSLGAAGCCYASLSLMFTATALLINSKVENSSKSTAQSTTAASRRGETPGSGRSPRVTRLGGVSRAPAPRILARSPPSGAPFLSSVAKVVFFHRAGHRFTVRVMHCNEIILCAATVTVSQSMVAQIEQKLGFAVEDQRLLKSGQRLSSMFKFCQDTVVELFLFQTGGMEEWTVNVGLAPLTMPLDCCVGFYQGSYSYENSGRYRGH